MLIFFCTLNLIGEAPRTNGASKKKSIAIVGFSSKLLVGLATNRDALSKIEPSTMSVLRSLDLSCGQVNFYRLTHSRQIVIRLDRLEEVVKGVCEKNAFYSSFEGRVDFRAGNLPAPQGMNGCVFFMEK